MSFRIPELTSGVIGASTLNLYGNAVNHLLGESHAAYALTQMQNSSGTTSITPSRRETRYLYHVTPLLWYVIALKIEDDGRGSTATCTFYDRDAETALGTVASTSTSWELKTGVIDISAHCAAQGYVPGDMLTIEAQLHTSNADSEAELYVFGFGERGVTTGWAALPAFTDGTASSAAHFNALRTDLNILHNNMVSPVNPLLTDAPRLKIQVSDEWRDVFRMAYRYRGDGLYVTVEGKGAGEDGWKWRLLSYAASNPSAATTLHTSDWNVGTADYILDSDAIDLSGAGWTRGNWYMLRLQALRDAGPTATIRRVWAIRTSTGMPGGSWVVPTQWAHGDTTMNNANLGKLTTDIAELYSGGAEELWGDTIAVLAAPDAAEGDREDRTFTGVHRKRWLIVRPHSGEAPILLYGANMAKTHSLSVNAGAVWQNYDLDSTPLPMGGHYAVTQCDVALEADEPCNG